MAKAFFYSKSGNVRIELANGYTKRFRKVSSMLEYCRNNGIEISLSDCITL